MIIKCLKWVRYTNPTVAWMTQTLSVEFLMKSPSVSGRADLVISSAKIKLALTAASLCDLAFLNRTCQDMRPRFNSSTFCSLCSIRDFCPRVSFHDTVSDYTATLPPDRRHTGFPTTNVNMYSYSNLVWNPQFFVSTFCFAIFLGIWKLTFAVMLMTADT